MSALTPRLLAGLVLAVIAVSPAVALEWGAHPATVLAGDPVTLKLEGLQPRAPVTIRAERLVAQRGESRLFRAEAQYLADAVGSLNLATDAPVSGSYSGADLRGLFWSMEPVDGDSPAGRFNATPSQVQLSAASGDRRADTTLTLLPESPQVQTQTVEAFPGALWFRLPANKPLPVLILLGGSEGGDSTARTLGPALASLGYAVLGLPYYSPVWYGQTAQFPELPRSFADIPVDRLEAVYKWLAEHPEADVTRIGLWGISKGAEFALLAATRFSWVRSVVAYVPSDVVWEGWGPDVKAAGTRASFSWRGEPLPFVPYRDMAAEFAGYQTGGVVRLRRAHDKGRAARPESAIGARIPVERFAGELLLVAGTDDQIWNSAAMAQNIAERRAAAGLPTEFVLEIDAGHALAGTGWAPTTQYNAGPGKGGGTPAANARGQAHAWAAMRRFINRTLAGD